MSRSLDGKDASLATKPRRRHERVSALAAALAGPGVLRLREAAQMLDVSEMTVRRDIALVPEQFQYLGGYIVARSPERAYEMAQEQGANAAAKEAICAHAATLVEDDDTIFIDCGTTTPYLARHLTSVANITAVCYSLNIAGPLAAMANVRLIMLGGRFIASSASFAVDEGLATLDRIGINKAFMSAGGVHPVRGVSCSNFHEVAVKQAVLRMALRRCLLVDGSKLGKVKPAPFAELGAFDTLITSPAEPAGEIERSFSGRLIVV